MARIHTLPQTLRLACCIATLAAPAAWAGGNLLVNGNAEAAAGATDGEVVPVPGWTTTAGAFTVQNYNPTFLGPDLDSPGPVDRGLNYFAGGPDATLSSAIQIVDLTPYQSYFSSHAFGFTLSGWFGGYGSQDDNANISVSFRDGAGNEIEFANTTPIYSGDRQNVTGLMFVSTGWAASNNVHINPASALITLTMNRSDGNYNDGYADNLLFSVEDGVPAVPEPTSLGLMLAGMAAIGLRLRGRAE